MLATASALTVNPMFLQHDLLIELGRLEIAINDVQPYDSAAEDLDCLQARRQAIAQTLRRLSV